MRFKQIITPFKILTLSLSCILFISCRNNLNNVLLITQIPGNIQNPDFITGESWRYMTGAQITAVDPYKPSSLKILTGKFHSACYPEISYDGRNMLFAAQENEG